jgi:transcriptional regulator with XRE-family HTH domain
VNESGFAIQFGLNVRNTRKALKATQEDLSLVSGLDRAQISLIESGGRSVRLESVYRLAMALNVQPGELLPKIMLPAKPRLPLPKAKKSKKKTT